MSSIGLIILTIILAIAGVQIVWLSWVLLTTAVIFLVVHGQSPSVK
jgi:hypothetical protein